MLRAGDPHVTAEEVVVDLLFVVGGAPALGRPRAGHRGGVAGLSAAMVTLLVVSR